MAYQKRFMLVMEEKDVTSVLKVINRHQGYFSDDLKIVRDNVLPKDPDKWIIKFNASSKEWSRITTDLNEIGDIVVKVSPGGASDMYFTRKES